MNGMRAPSDPVAFVSRLDSSGAGMGARGFASVGALGAGSGLAASAFGAPARSGNAPIGSVG
jgi:hypothetical protein